MPKATRLIPHSRLSAPDLRTWRQLVSKVKATSRPRSDREIDDNLAMMAAYSRAAWSAPTDIRVLADIAMFWRFPREDKHALREFQSLISVNGAGSIDDMAVAHLIRSAIAGK